MTLALASRGYLCFATQGLPPVYGEGPSLIDATNIAPEISASGDIESVPPPTGVGESMAPTINGAESPVVIDSTEGPQISGAYDMTPGIILDEE